MARWTDISASDGMAEEFTAVRQRTVPVNSAARPELHELVNALTAVGLGINTSLLWLEREEPDVEAAKRTARKLIVDFSRMERLVSAALVNAR